jgi:hypothetical protein
MSQVPTIFVSSVFDSLLELRSDIYKIITEEYGWNCNAYEHNKEQYAGSAVDACRSKVDDSDLYIGLFWKKEGSRGIEETPISEMEFYRACNKRIPVRIYDIDPPPGEREKGLEVFLESIKSPDNGVILSTYDYKDITKNLRRFLDHFGDLWEKGKKLSPPAFLYDTLKKYKENRIRLSPTDIYLPGAVQQKALSEREASYLLQQMFYYYGQKDFYSTVVTGAGLWNYFLTDKNISDRKTAVLFTEFLQVWAGSCTWLGITSPIFGLVAAALLRTEMFRRLDQYPFMYDSNSLISHVYYVDASIKRNQADALRLDLNHIGNREMKLELGKRLKVLEKESVEGYKKSKMYDGLYINKSDPPQYYSYNAYIYEALGDHANAEIGFKNLIRHYNRTSDESALLDVLADYGSTLALRGVEENLPSLRNKGMKMLRDSYERSRQKHFQTPHYIMIGKEYAKRLISTGDLSTAESLLKGLLDEAINRKFFQQAETIQILQDKTLSLME